jgi:uncharacterized membrane protein YcaP (DUF421 family)
VVVALGSVAGGAPLRPNTPLVAMVIAVLVLMFSALLVDVAYAYGWAPPKLVVGKPTLLYANGESGRCQCALSCITWKMQQCFGHT